MQIRLWLVRQCYASALGRTSESSYTALRAVRCGRSSLPSVSRLVPRDIGAAQCGMLRGASGHTLPPHFERATLHLSSHERDYRGFVQTKLLLNRLKRRAILPRHLDDARDVGIGVQNRALQREVSI